ncbi:MAG: hypothetical protein WC816_09520 [Sphingomonas sp.]
MRIEATIAICARPERSGILSTRSIMRYFEGVASSLVLFGSLALMAGVLSL